MNQRIFKSMFFVIILMVSCRCDVMGQHNRPVANQNIVDSVETMTVAQFRTQVAARPLLHQLIVHRFALLHVDIDSIKVLDFVVTFEHLDQFQVTNKDQFLFSDHPDVKKWIYNTKPGYKIYFEDIKVKTPDRRIRTLPTVTLVLK